MPEFALYDIKLRAVMGRNALYIILLKLKVLCF